jgi:hypothetical protein
MLNSSKLRGFDREMRQDRADKFVLARPSGTGNEQVFSRQYKKDKANFGSVKQFYQLE